MTPLAVAFPWKPGPYQDPMPVWVIRLSEAGDGGNLTLDGGREQATRNNNGGRKNRGRARECNISNDRFCRVAGLREHRPSDYSGSGRKKEKENRHATFSLHSTLALYRVLSMTRITTVRPA